MIQTITKRRKTNKSRNNDNNLTVRGEDDEGTITFEMIDDIGPKMTCCYVICYMNNNDELREKRK